jgi:hypothetical protein
MAQSEQYKIQLLIEGKDYTGPALNSVNRELGEMQTGVNRTTQAWGSFKTGVTTALGAFAIAGGVAAIVGQINDLGFAANAAEKTFTQVAGGADEAAASLARMRQLTGGVIDDMSLMKGASSLLVTGIAQTNEQAEELVNLGARLGSVMGVDAAESISNLNSALLNNSFMRLDTLGISAARVRERVNELKEAGMDMSEAFSQAVLEIGSQTLEDLGAAAGVAETAIGRLSVQFNNMGQDLAQFVNLQLETAATTLEQLGVLWNYATTGNTGIPEVDARINALQELNTLAQQYDAQIRALDDIPQYFSTLDADLQTKVGTFFFDNAEMAETFATNGEEASTYFRDAFNSGNEQTIAEARAILSDVFGEEYVASLSLEELQEGAIALDVAFTASANAARDLGIETQAVTAVTEEQTRAMRAQENVLAARSMIFRQITSEINDIVALNNDLNESFESGTFTNSSGTVFFDSEQLADVRNQAEAVADEYERLKALGESSEFTLVSELEVERAREIAESADATAEAAERNARAWETASLAMIAGATGGGRQNEFNQMVLANIEDPELRAQAESQFNLASGVETVETRLLEYGASLVAAITDEFGVAAGQRAGQDFMTAFEEGIAMGLSGEALQDYVEAEVGYALEGSATGTSAGTGEQITVQAGEGYNALAERTGYTVEELRAETGGRMLMAGEVITIGDSQLIALDENSSVETVQSASANVLQTTAQAPQVGQADYTYYDPSTGNYSVSSNDPYTAMDAGAADYTYYDPASGQYSYSMNPTNQPAPISPETAEATGEVADDMLSIETSVTNIAATDMSATVDPLVNDVDNAVAKVDEFQSKMTTIADTDWSIEVPISFVFDNTTAELLSRNSQVVETIRLILPQLGINPTS